MKRTKSGKNGKVGIGANTGKEADVMLDGKLGTQNSLQETRSLANPPKRRGPRVGEDADSMVEESVG